MNLKFVPTVENIRVNFKDVKFGENFSLTLDGNIFVKASVRLVDGNEFSIGWIEEHKRSAFFENNDKVYVKRNTSNNLSKLSDGDLFMIDGDKDVYMKSHTSLGYSIYSQNCYYQGFILNLRTKIASPITNLYLPVIEGILASD